MKNGIPGLGCEPPNPGIFYFGQSAEAEKLKNRSIWRNT